MKILITGSDGQLGKSLIEQAPRSLEIIETNKKTSQSCSSQRLL